MTATGSKAALPEVLQEGDRRNNLAGCVRRRSTPIVLVGCKLVAVRLRTKRGRGFCGGAEQAREASLMPGTTPLNVEIKGVCTRVAEQ